MIGLGMKLSDHAATWNDGVIKTDPGDPLAKKLQRLFSARWSEGLEERRMDEPDETWVRQSQSGDPTAFEPLIRRHQRMIFSLAYRMTGSSTEAEDLTQETFIRAYRNIGSYRAASKFSTWLYRIAINVCLTWRQRETLRVEVHSNWAEREAVGESAGTGSELGGRVQAALLKLPAKQRAAIMLTIYEGFNHAEAAKILGCSEATVSWRVFVARRKLKGWLRADRE
jgi:RNA polymerase sigma-70 factor, ECF subfamily